MEPKTVRRAEHGQTTPQSAQDASHGIPVGTHVMTDQGLRAVETLSTGDLVETRNGGLQPLVAVTAVTRATRAIKFTEGCFGKSGPALDLLLPDGQPVLIRDWRARALFGQSQAMIRAGQLVDEAFIHDIGPRRMVLFRLEFDRARVVQAHGMELGTSDIAVTPLRAVA